ncbi:uncharacterized protein MELLADRAFT_93925 [Melampsora larici-populina 98AG31]|uniref:Uncharacterized protein n=1 Tax=Melampsora larici-populina (strain 98AG31 / pathotype 3-4-7) TaxID=747676 RepID=F4S5S3_MELLP|nr:uncharacterized protein MELLADRAFT_93925 [Melampsora larici-populina 98AG31]EGG00014.1 hypothetical protein MELLADRAFT_93925 [Melampsora larici-populina 98AG31]
MDLNQLKEHDVAPAKASTTSAKPVAVTPNLVPSDESEPVAQSATTAPPIGEEEKGLENQNAPAQPTSAQPTSSTESFWSVLESEISQTTPGLGQTTPVASLPVLVDHDMNQSTPGPSLLSRFGSRSVSPMTRITKYNKRQQLDNREAEGSNSKKRRNI